MKKLVLLLGVMLLVAQGAYAADKFGSVDLGKVMQQYSKSQEATKWAQGQEKSIQNFIADARKKVAAAPDAQKKDLEEKYNKELISKVEALRKNKEVKVKQIGDAVEGAIQAVGKEGGYTLILPASTTLYGSEDVTDKIVAKLNAK
jgi:Skp family chaperone for outer membrane proteins